MLNLSRWGPKPTWSRCCKCGPSTSQAETDWPCLAAAALHNPLRSLLPLIHLTVRVKLERIFFRQVMLFFPLNPNTIVCLGPCNAPKQKQKKAGIKPFPGFAFPWLQQLTELLFFLCSVFGFFLFSSSSVQSSCASSKGSR